MEKSSVFEDKKVIILVALFCMFLWGSAVPVTKLSYGALNFAQDEVFTRIFFAGLRFFIASFMVLAYLFVKNKGKDEHRFNKLQGKDWKLLITIGLLRITICYYFYYIALANISGVKGSVLVSSSTFITVLIAPLIVKEDKFNPSKLAALVLGFSGIIIANISKGFDMSFTMRGEGYMLLSGLFTAIVEVLIRPKSKGVSAPVITWGQLLFGSIPLIIIGYLGLERSLPWNGLAISLLLYGSFISAVAFILWYELLKVNNAGEIAIYRLFIPIFGSIISAIILPNETFTLSLVIGLILVVLGIYVLNTYEKKHVIK